MNRTAHLLRQGWASGGLALMASLRSVQEMLGTVAFVAAFCVGLSFMRGRAVEGTSVDAATAALPGVLGLSVVFTGVVATAMVLATEREDGTLLRAKALPDGITVYLIGKIVYAAALVLTTVALLVLPGLFLFDGLAAGLARGWPLLLGVLLLGMVATIPFGAVLGSLFNNPRLVNAVGAVPIFALTGISGIFFPITALPEWLQWIAQAFPVYWVGLGLRSAVLPDSMLSAEIGESWRHLETMGALGAWAVLGLALAPWLLRRTARRVSGANVEEARQKAMQRV
ncbi:ABC transporter permease [Nocardiopsis suaedae]|uniref:ABC transporter permease n=1 Tax=Nocardiopsis suaedae TaxID=3018444 RepID=A0ABT4TM97_9ACTN|nr:ABC transporter permease [Nocardiopsis suaedae]MDA2805817.1 ABC transporter permease [Nocardiopsis suaedae]